MIELTSTTTDAAPCPYLPDRQARTELTLATGSAALRHVERLEAGYRRFGPIFFRPVCEGCAACIPLRVVVERFRPSDSQRRVLRRNRDVRVEVGEPDLDGERLDLHRAFHRERSERVGWPLRVIGEEEYRRTFLLNPVPTLELRYRVDGVLVAVAYVDVSPGALNSIYCFHHPRLRRRSLGTFDVLTEIGLAARLGIPHLYLGYTISACRSMSYKASFRPAEVLVDGSWRPLDG